MAKVADGTPPVAPAADRATVVFIRDSGFGFAVNFAIIDHAGSMLGDAVARSHFAIELPPGSYFFVARGGENTDVVRADVAAGHLYHVRVVPHFGAFLARVELDPIKPDEGEWSSLPAWLAESDHLRPLITSTPARISESPLPDWATEAWSSLSPSEQFAHTLKASDGRPVSRLPPTRRLAPVAAVDAVLAAKGPASNP